MYFSASLTGSRAVAGVGFGVARARSGRFGTDAAPEGALFGSDSAAAASLPAPGDSSLVVPAGGASVVAGGVVPGVVAALPEPEDVASVLAEGALPEVALPDAGAAAASGIAWIAGCDDAPGGFAFEPEPASVPLEGAPFEAACPESEFGCVTAGDFFIPDISDDNPSCRKRKYPNPTASARATRIRKIFAAPPLRGSSSSSSR